jgi:haloalkane dehalogenase
VRWRAGERSGTTLSPIRAVSKKRPPFHAAPELPPAIAREVEGFKRYRVDTGAWRMHVMEVGAGPAVLMLHGNPTWGFLYRRVARLLAEGYRVIMPDLVGFGLSDKPHQRCLHTIENHASWLGELVDALDLREFIFVGQDWGGPIGLRLLADRPWLARGMVLMNTVVGPPKAGSKPTSFHRFARMPIISDLAFRGLNFPLPILHRVQGDPGSIRGDVARAYAYPFEHLRDRKGPLALARMVPDTDQHPSVPALVACQSFADAYRGPVGLVWGLRDPILGRLLPRTQRTFPNARSWETQAGHFLQEEVPETIAEAVSWVASQT